MGKRTDSKTAEEIINALGGTSAVAFICEIAPASVSAWRKKGIPEGRLLYLQKRFKKIPLIKNSQAY